MRHTSPTGGQRSGSTGLATDHSTLPADRVSWRSFALLDRRWPIQAAHRRDLSRQRQRATLHRASALPTAGRLPQLAAVEAVTATYWRSPWASTAGAGARPPGSFVARDASVLPSALERSARSVDLIERFSCPRPTPLHRMCEGQAGMTPARPFAILRHAHTQGRSIRTQRSRPPCARRPRVVMRLSSSIG